DAEARQKAVAPATARADRFGARGIDRLQAGTQRQTRRTHLHLRHAERTHRHHLVAARSRRGGHRLQGPEHAPGHAGADFRGTGEGGRMNLHGIRAIYKFEMARTGRTLMQSVLSPVVSTSLYFVVFGSA